MISKKNTQRKAPLAKLFFCLISMMVLWTTDAQAQIASYGFSQVAGSYSAVSGGTQLIAAATDDASSTATNIGFTFNLAGTNYTQFVANSNGNIRLGASAPTSQYSPISTTSNTGAISGFGRDGKTGGAVVYLLSGSAPNRVLTIDYPDFNPTYSNATYKQSFQIKLFETTNVIQIIYGPNASPTTYTCQVGIRATAADFANRTTTTNWAASTAGTASSTMTWSATVYPANGLTYTWTPPSCGAPTALVGSPTTPTTANISWTAPLTPPSNGYEYAVTTSATPPGSGTAFAGTSTSVSGLTAQTTYYLHVRSYCGGSDYSAWATSTAFTTPCNAISSLPWTEGFESAILPNLPSTCWLEAPSSGDWITTNNGNSSNDADARTGSQFLRDAWSATNEFVWTPGFALTSGQSYDFSFWWAGDNYSGWTGDIFYNTVQSGTGATQMGSSFVTSGTTTTKTYVQEKRTFIAPTTGTYYFAVRVNASSVPYYLSFDDFRFEQTPSCAAPTALVGSPTTSTTANISWTAPLTPPSNGYEYAVTTSATPPGSGTAFAGTSTSVTGLIANTTYYLHVRSYCGGSSYSPWVTSSFYTGYCISTSSGTGYYISNFVTTAGVTNISNNSGGISGSGYGNFTAQTASNYDGGPTTNYTATWSTTGGVGFGLWIDWNNDMDFNDANEAVYVSSSYNFTNSYSGSITVPSGTPNGNYRLRIRMDYNSPSPSPCGTITSGETEDYTFSVVAAPSCLSPTALSGTPTTATTANISWTAPLTPPSNGYEYAVTTSATPPGSGTTFAGTSTSVTGLTAQTTYYLHVRSYCGGSDYSAWATSASFTTFMDCATATVVTCGTDFSFSVTSGSGTWNTTATGACSATPGKEKLYSFTPAITGVYYLDNTVSGSGEFADAYIKPATGGCSDALSWTCVGWYLSSLQHYSLGTLTAGTEYYIMLDAEDVVDGATQTLKIACIVPPPANDDCAGALSFASIPTNGSCANLTLNTAGATQSLAGCAGTADDDVWFKFVQPAGFTTINFANTSVSGNTDRVIEFFSACGGTSLKCSDPETGTVTGLTPGSTYYGRIFTYGSGTSTNVTVCLSVPPPAPANDNCAGALSFASIPTDGSCANLTLNTAGATQSLAGCTGTADDDVWFKFVQPAGFTTINFANTSVSGNTDRVIEFFSACGGTSLKCSDPETGTVTGLTPGSTYYGRIFTYGSGTSTNVTVCLSVPPPAPANDNCAGALSFASIPTDGSCANLTLNTAGATQSLVGCIGTADDDVWFKFVQPAGFTTINFANTSVSGNTDRVIEFFDACGGTSLKCSDPETGTVTGLTPGSTYYGRIFTYGSGTSTNVTVCLSVPPPAPANDDCAGAKLLTNCAKPDTTKNLSGATQSLAAITCGSYTGTADDDIWYKFVASASTMYITCFSSYDAVMDLRSGACNGSNIECADDGVGINTFEDIVATGLTVGNTYYVRIYSYSSTKPTATDYVWATVGEGGCWQGASSTDWADVNNWSNLAVPNACATNVTIPAGTPFSPEISAASYAVGSVNIASGASLVVSGSNSLNVCGNWNAGSGSLVTVSGTGKVVLNGTVAQTVNGKTNFSTLQIDKSSSSTTLASGSTVGISTALELKAGNINVSAGSLTLKSADADNAAMLDNFSIGFNGTITGNISAERGYNFASDPGLHKQHYFSSPINSVAITQFAPASGVNGGWVTPKSNCDEMAMAAGTNYGNVFEYDESHVSTCHLEAWKVRSAGTADNGRAYSVVKPSAGTLTLTGAPNLGSYTVGGLTNSNWVSMLTPQGNSYESGWSLLGNPYSASLDLDYTVNGDFDNAIQVLHTSGMYAGTYQPITMSGSGVIAPFQGFMAHKTSPGGTDTFSINAANRSRTTATFQKNGEHQMNLTVLGNGFADITYFNFDANSTTGFDADKDGGKLASYDGQPTLYSIIGAVWTSINTNPDVASTPSIPVGFNPGSNGAYQITGGGFEDLQNTIVYLEDKQTNTMHNLTALPEYTFTANKGDATERFVLHFNYEMPSSIQTIVSNNLNIFSYENNVVVDFNNAKISGEHTIVIYDIMGREISNEKFAGKVYTKTLDVQEPMYVVVKTNDGNNVTSKKLFVTK